MTAEAEASHRAALWLSLMLTLLGSCGGCNGMRHYQAGPVPSADLIEANDAPGSAELANLAVVAAHVFVDDPNRRPLALTNVVLSAMLVASGFLIGIRHRNARWFVTNAIVANLLWIVADGAFDVLRLLDERQALAAAVAAWIHTSHPPGPALTSRDEWSMAHGWVTSLAAVAAFLSAGSLLVHAYVLARLRSPAVEAFLNEERG